MISRSYLRDVWVTNKTDGLGFVDVMVPGGMAMGIYIIFFQLSRSVTGAVVGCPVEDIICICSETRLVCS